MATILRLCTGPGHALKYRKYIVIVKGIFFSFVMCIRISPAPVWCSRIRSYYICGGDLEKWLKTGGHLGFCNKIDIVHKSGTQYTCVPILVFVSTAEVL